MNTDEQADNVEIDMQVGNAAIKAFNRLPYQPWYALAEYIDNATQSLSDNGHKMQQESVEVSIVFDAKQRTISIVDNAFGMGPEVLKRALTVGKPPVDPSGRSRYGMGMKTASCWFGNEWTIATKQFGLDAEYEFTIDVNAFADGAAGSTKLVTRPKSKEDHWTRIELKKVTRQLSPGRIKEISGNLASIFRKDIMSGRLCLKIDGTEVTYTGYEMDSFAKRSTGGYYYQAFDHVVDGIHINGWIACFNEGTGSQKKTGIAIFQNDRCIMGGPDAWRPDNMFGEARGGTVNQRLVGELNLDDHKIEISHTKDAVLWQGTQQEDIEEYLKEVAVGADILKMARQTYSRSSNDTVKRDAGVSAFKDWSTSADLAGRIGIVPVPTPESANTRTEFVIEATREADPDFTVSIPGIDRKIFVKIMKLGANDPYYAYEITQEGDLITVINESHPGYQTAEQSENPLFTYFVHCALDSWAEWKCQLLRGEISPASVREIKDDILKYRPGI